MGMKMDEILEELGRKFCFPRRDISCIKIPVNCVEFTDEGIEQFNRLYCYCLEMERSGRYTRLQWTQGKGKPYYNIRTGKEVFKPPAWSIVRYGSGADIYIIDEHWFRFQLRPHKEDSVWNGVHCYYYFKKVCKERFGIDLEDYYISPEEGDYIHRHIVEAPVNVVEQRYIDQTYYHVHHLDLNASYFSGIAQAFPELEPPIQYFYQNRKKNPHNKEILTHTSGYFRCDKIGRRLAHLTAAGIEYTKIQLNVLTEEITRAGYWPLSYTTDGIWYAGLTEEPYHGPGEGPDLGQWKNDHINCQWRIQSPKAYEFIENGKYNVRLSGRTILERQYPRELWGWGDLKKAQEHGVIYYIFDRKRGFEKIIGDLDSYRIFDNKTIKEVDISNEIEMDPV